MLFVGRVFVTQRFIDFKFKTKTPHAGPDKSALAVYVVFFRAHVFFVIFSAKKSSF